MKKIRLILCISALFLVTTSYSQIEKGKGETIINLLNYVHTWGSTTPTFSIKLNVYCNNLPVQQDLIRFAAYRAADWHGYVLKNPKRPPSSHADFDVTILNSIPQSFEKTQVLYLSGINSSQLSQIIKAVGNSKTLVITDSPGFAHLGAGINLVMDGTKVKYEVNKANILKQGFTIDDALLQGGIVVN